MAKKRSIKPAPPKAKAKATPKNRTSKAVRRVAIVKGLVEQQTPSEIAAAVGISRKTVYEELKAPETQELIRRWMSPYHDEIQQMIPGTIAILKAKIEILATAQGFGDTLDMLRIIRGLGLVMGWAQGKTGGEESSPMRRFSGTMEDLLVVYRSLTAGEAEHSAS